MRVRRLPLLLLLRSAVDGMKRARGHVSGWAFDFGSCSFCGFASASTPSKSNKRTAVREYVQRAGVDGVQYGVLYLDCS